VQAQLGWCGAALVDPNDIVQSLSSDAGARDRAESILHARTRIIRTWVPGDDSSGVSRQKATSSLLFRLSAALAQAAARTVAHSCSTGGIPSEAVLHLLPQPGCMVEPQFSFGGLPLAEQVDTVVSAEGGLVVSGTKSIVSLTA